MGYSENSKAYRIHFQGFKKINIRKYVTFNEDLAYNKSRERPVEDSEETEVPRIQDATMNDEDREIEEPQEPIDPPQEKNPHKIKPAWVREAIQCA